jgi:hypothetical protein
MNNYFLQIASVWPDDSIFEDDSIDGQFSVRLELEAHPILKAMFLDNDPVVRQPFIEAMNRNNLCVRVSKVMPLAVVVVTRSRPLDQTLEYWTRWFNSSVLVDFASPHYRFKEIKFRESHWPHIKHQLDIIHSLRNEVTDNNKQFNCVAFCVDLSNSTITIAAPNNVFTSLVLCSKLDPEFCDYLSKVKKLNDYQVKR